MSFEKLQNLQVFYSRFYYSLLHLTLHLIKHDYELEGIL